MVVEVFVAKVQPARVLPVVVDVHCSMVMGHLSEGLLAVEVEQPTCRVRPFESCLGTLVAYGWNSERMMGRVAFHHWLEQLPSGDSTRQQDSKLSLAAT